MAARKPSLRRLSQVYVEIPQSPLHKSRNVSKHSPHVSTTTASRKENALLHASSSQMITNTISASSPHKRKLDVDTTAEMSDQPSTKKHKAPQPKPSGKPEIKKLANASEEYPNGFVYCHQCNRKRDVEDAIHCTIKDLKGRRCGAKYCKPCLKNRYGLLLEDILAEGEDEETKQNEHVHGEGYNFKCPRCDDVCNCVACRKAKGLQPTGNLANAARQSGLTSAADVLRQDPKAAGPMAHRPTIEKTDKKAKAQQTAPAASSKNGDLATSKSLSAPVKGKGKQQPDAKTKPAALSAKDTKSKAESGSRPGPKPKAKALPKPKPIIKPVWTSVDSSLSLSDAEERINIREFVLRFSAPTELSRAHLDELEELRPSRARDDDGDDLVPWVSEGCVKALLLFLLSLLDASGEGEKRLKAAVKSIRDGGAQLNKMWCALATLRDWQENASTRLRSASSGSLLSFPDPLPPPESTTIIRTRSGANQDSGGIKILRTAQLVPVISALVNAVVESEQVREALEAGAQEAKERVKEAREAHRLENERFEQEKEREKAKEKKLDKSKMEYHKRVITGIDDALKVASSVYTTRISPLGRDSEGRVYWALTPGMMERDAALHHLQQYSQGKFHKNSSRSLNRRRPLVPSEEDRSALKKWSWFLAVWGKRPPATERTVVHDPDDSESESEDEDDDDEQWWGFWDPEEIEKLASWVHVKAGLADVASVKSASVRSLSRTRSPESDVDMDDLTDDEDSDGGTRDVDMEISAVPTEDEVRSLVKELEQYAALLRCRVRRDEEIEEAGPSTK
ncbi:hypothetical protein HYDPIDRAFT_189618 [Hydnomerulius pinastri MD-312]|uniref:Zinc-finger domain-containing protein n=1 Tax=Hydnomerulius pinastri MD-312 TaxID=994086 RepID=A0A0C9VTK6_9AGAM|nr:hypothetical protein HYDPIDRAFT_189618 [Hydnomerulius pinastri MD-312]